MHSDSTDRPRVNCFECRHHFITYEPAFPYGCRAMGFKSREFPAAVVLHDSGAPCLMFEPKDGSVRS